MNRKERYIGGPYKELSLTYRWCGAANSVPPHISTLYPYDFKMKAYKFSISKILFDILSTLAGAIAIQIIVDFIYAPELFQNLKAITISMSFFALMMLITYAAFTYAAPTIKFVKFENDHFHLKFIPWP